MAFRPLPAQLWRRPGRTRAAELANRLNTAAIRLLRRIGRDDGADGVTGARLSALSVIVYGGPVAVGELARRERVAAPTISRIVDALVRDGLVRRTAGTADRRSVQVAATARGRKLMERGRARRIQALAAELTALKEQELALLDEAVAILGRMEQTRIPATQPGSSVSPKGAK